MLAIIIIWPVINLNFCVKESYTGNVENGATLFLVSFMCRANLKCTRLEVRGLGFNSTH